MNEMDSRTFGAVLRSCRFQCETHLVLREAEDRFRRSQQLKRTSYTLTHTHINTHDKNRKSTSEDTERSKREKHRLSHQPSDRCKRRRPHGLSQCFWDCWKNCSNLKCLKSSFDRTRPGEPDTPSWFIFIHLAAAFIQSNNVCWGSIRSL